MDSPVISIICAFYNTGPKLLDMIKSIYSQTFSDWELILLNDGSTDDSLQIAKSVNDVKIHVYDNGCNLGRAASRNQLVKLAKGQYIALMDADDMSATTRLQKQYELLQSNLQLDVVGTGICYPNNSDIPVGQWIPSIKHDVICANPERTFGICHGSIMARKEWFGLFPYNSKIKLAEDYDLFLSAYKQSKFGNVPEPLYYYRLDPSYNLKKQLHSRYCVAKVLFYHYRKNEQWNKIITCWLVQFVKALITVVMFVLGQRSKLMSKRYNKLTEEQFILHKREIQKIKETQLPLKVI